MKTPGSKYTFATSGPGTGKSSIIPRSPDSNIFTVHIVSNGELRHCEDCGARMMWMIVVHEPYKKNYPYLSEPHHCIGCVKKNEQAYVERIKDEDLPLFIGHTWFTDQAADDYKARLAALLQN